MPAEPSATDEEPTAPEAGTGLAGMGLPIWLAVVPLRALAEPQAPRMAEREVSVPHAMAWAIHWRRLKLSTASIISTEQEIFIERIVVACKKWPYVQGSRVQRRLKRVFARVCGGM